MKYYIYMSILVCCLSVSSPAFAQSTSTCQPIEESITQGCTFTPVQNSAIAIFDCPSGLTGPNNSCPDPGAHSIKFTVGNVVSPFGITVTPTKVTGDGICDSGIPGGPDPEPGTSLSSVDCRFVRFFGDPAYNNNEPPLGPGPPNPNTKVPFCYRYALFGQEPACVVYSVFGPDPSDGFYNGGVQKRIAWNNRVATPVGYMPMPGFFDDPHNDGDTNPANANCPPVDLGNDNVFPYEPGQPEDSQFVCNIATSFSNKPNTVGTDPTIVGDGKSFNDFVVAFRFCTEKQDDVEGGGREQGDDGHEGEFEFCQRSKHMEFDEPDTGRKMKGSMDAVTLNGNQAVISGAGTLVDGTPVNYTAVVLGNAPVIGANHFAISWITATGLAFQTSGALIDGFIVVPTLPPPPPL
jgi:hypothetical protein